MSHGDDFNCWHQCHAVHVVPPPLLQTLRTFKLPQFRGFLATLQKLSGWLILKIMMILKWRSMSWDGVTLSIAVAPVSGRYSVKSHTIAVVIVIR
jgi:hypothetical protein